MRRVLNGLAQATLQGLSAEPAHAWTPPARCRSNVGVGAIDVEESADVVELRLEEAGRISEAGRSIGMTARSTVREPYRVI